ncbi:MAG: choice-of-anchor N protein [Pseudomonadota bacterium]
MKHTFSSLRMGAVALTVWLGLFAGTANAIPTLQLGIAGGTYDWSTQTVVSTGPSFSLYAYLLPNSGNLLTDTYYLSMAVTPQVSTPASLGSFTYNGNTVNVTSDMTYGTPPIDAFSSSYDPGDLAKHGMFPTYFKEVAFSFSSTNQSGAFNTQDNPTWGPQTGSGMYYNLFSIDTSNLADGYAIHFDLYNTKLCLKSKGQCASSTDTDITQFAPFSHDAQSSVSPIPEPQTYAMLLAGLGLIGFMARRRKNLDF